MAAKADTRPFYEAMGGGFVVRLARCCKPITFDEALRLAVYLPLERWMLYSRPENKLVAASRDGKVVVHQGSSTEWIDLLELQKQLAAKKTK